MVTVSALRIPPNGAVLLDRTWIRSSSEVVPWIKRASTDEGITSWAAAWCSPPNRMPQRRSARSEEQEVPNAEIAMRSEELDGTRTNGRSAGSGKLFLQHACR